MINLNISVLLLMLISLWGCSSGNSNSVILDASGKHPSGWAVANTGGDHPASYLASPEKCAECHGADLKGGTSKVSCFSANYNGISCHAQGPSGHPAGWSNPAAHGAHAKAAAVGADGMNFCTNCHGADYRGAGASQKDCLRCHTTAPHAPKPWFGGAYTHSNTDTSNAPACAACHTAGQNLSAAAKANLPATATIGATGCFNNTLCHGVIGHSNDPQPWSSPSNHGPRAKSDPSIAGNTGFAACQQCHGVSFDIVLSVDSCVTCHGVNAPHPTAANWRFTGAITHTDTGVNNASVCIQCHAAATPRLAEPYLTRFASSPAGSFKAGTPNCFTATMCHGDVRKTSNCDACHSTATTNPFKSMAGATSPTDTKVGAHVKHLNATLSSPVACSECHSVPASPAVAGEHRNNVNNVTFGTLAKTGGLTPAYTAATGVCANTYCHGARMAGGDTTGSNRTPVWWIPFLPANLTAATCGTCHGFPPSTASGHPGGITIPAGFPATANIGSTCSCHSNISTSGNSYANIFVNKALHINGIFEPAASGSPPHVFPYPGSLHAAAGATPSNCSGTGCHNITVTGPYPAVPSGTAPNCRACHLSSLGAGCTDCHATPPNGNPNTFPNRARSHDDPNDHAVDCAVCHAGGGTGTTTHGNSGGNIKSSADVILQFSIIPPVFSDSMIDITRGGSNVTCTGTCHIGNKNQDHGDNW